MLTVWQRSQHPLQLMAIHKHLNQVTQLANVGMH